MARPMPLVEPVTIATLPVRSNSWRASVTDAPRSCEGGEVDLAGGHGGGEACVDEEIYAVHVDGRVGTEERKHGGNLAWRNRAAVGLADVPVDDFVGHRLAEVFQERRVDWRRAYRVCAHTAADRRPRRTHRVDLYQLLREKVGLYAERLEVGVCPVESVV